MHIERKGYHTLYSLFYEDFGFKNTLPPKLAGPVGSRLTFMFGHMLMFLTGLPTLHFPFLLHTLCIVLATAVVFKNGAKFYITYFWKVYDKQIHEFEKQVAEAAKAAEAARYAELSKEVGSEVCRFEADDENMAADGLEAASDGSLGD